MGVRIRITDQGIIQEQVADSTESSFLIQTTTNSVDSSITALSSSVDSSITTVAGSVTTLSSSCAGTDDNIRSELRASTVVAVAASAIDLANGQRYFTKTASGALSWTFSNVPASGAVVAVLELTNGGTGTQTWPAAVKWPGGTAPTLTAAGVDVLAFVTDDGGTIWRGVALMTDSK